MDDSDILVSICVPTYNRQFLLERNVSFHLKEFRARGIAFELVVVDDCSTDETAAYLASLAEEPEVSAYRRARNSGFVSNYAFAMRRAKGRYAIFLGDDDLLISDQVVEYLRIMEGDPALGMIQAPWLLVDGRPGGGDMQPFYHLDGPQRFERGDFGGMLEFILHRHVFPEFLIIRRDVLAQSISSATPFIFWAFLYTARALDKGDVLFLPQPFARVTALSDDPRLQQGNRECMFDWDTYRGGLEFLASHMFGPNQTGEEDRSPLVSAIGQFMALRHSVALRLLMQAQHWVEAYVLYHRMSAYRRVETDVPYDLIRTLAAITMAATEAGEFSAAPAIVDPELDAAVLSMMAPKLLDRLTHELPAGDGGEPRAWLRASANFGKVGADDAVFDVDVYLKQFF